ncbi:MAG: DUF3108 domain-containing protein [Candidatus Omnitrophota bacterium]|nr:DUF3108 domain-containing protein [Candidatus Omnitrophota bacterium]
MRNKQKFSQKSLVNYFVKACVLFLLLCMSSCAYRPKITIVQLPPEVEKIIITPEKNTIVPGERLSYAVDWHGIYAGEIILLVKEIVKFNDRECYHIIAQAHPTGLFRMFYNVKYFVETYIDKDLNRPLKFYKKKLFKKKVTEETINFDYHRNVAVWECTGKKSIEISLPKDAQDLLSSLYYFRLENLTLGQEYPINIVYNGKIWALNAKIDTLQMVKMHQVANIKAFAVKLSSKLSEYITGEEKIKIYFSMKSKHTPLFFNIRTKVGRLMGVLRDMPKEETNEPNLCVSKERRRRTHWVHH